MENVTPTQVDVSAQPQIITLQESTPAPQFGTPDLTLAPSSVEVKLDLGGGQNVAAGFQCVDLNAPKAEYKFDLFKFPWPLASDSVDELNCSHFIEHIPNRDLTDLDVIEGGDRIELVGKDMFFAFFDECWRILKKDSWMTVVWPALKSVRAFQDPTHRRFIPLETMSYLNADWRKAQSLDHYRVKCHFNGDLTFTTPIEVGACHPEAQNRYVKNFWDCVIDYQCKMQAKK